MRKLVCGTLGTLLEAVGLITASAVGRQNGTVRAVGPDVQVDQTSIGLEGRIDNANGGWKGRGCG